MKQRTRNRTCDKPPLPARPRVLWVSHVFLEVSHLIADICDQTKQARKTVFLIWLVTEFLTRRRDLSCLSLALPRRKVCITVHEMFVFGRRLNPNTINEV